ncbi:MAG: single-stranded-DNA-specific exonuclease RecJ [Candidatus Sericytochromatia bacterium]|nr:single-stranded-DNA-specific exonuclease RecJ [Candidatus Sericytochromatia bacterium]MEB3221370.1 single-stranded-DNA-specific exonuclease RecJ [Candidatus Sericytochromatia bacterium]
MPHPARIEWRVRQPEPDALAALEAMPGTSRLLAQVLAARGWRPGPALTTFLAPPSTREPDYGALPGVPEAVTLLLGAIARRERITVCGDYDIDGIASTSLLVRALEHHDAVVDHFLPHRLVEGYGLNATTIQGLADQGTRVLVTVDNGISSHEQIAFARSLGLDVIITDHHRPGASLPNATVIVNPWLMADPGGLAPLAGVGVAYALARSLDHALPPREPDARHLLDLVALGTLGDQAPLVDENRRLVRQGLARISRSPRRGVAALARAARCNLKAANLSELLSQRVIPRINAAGRMAHPRLALELLLAHDDAPARQMADQLERLNQERRLLSLAIEAEAIARVAGGDMPGGPAIILADAGWHHGVLGIVASRLAERFRRPTLLFAPEDNGHLRGSGRSVSGHDLHATLEAVGKVLGRFGGHANAVGLSVAPEDFEFFCAIFQAEVAVRLTAPVSYTKVWEVDAEPPLSALGFEAVASLQALEPTGPENPGPTFGLRGATVLRQERRGPEDEHLWLEVADQTGQAAAIAFGQGKRHPLPEGPVDLVYQPVAERWQGQNRLTLKVLAVGPAADA